MFVVLSLFPTIINSYVVELQLHRSDLSKTKIRLLLNDGSILFLREIVIANILHDYSYQWMTANGELLIRWDNAAHYEHIPTFPHHKHVGNEKNIQPSYEQNLLQVLTYIQSTL